MKAPLVVAAACFVGAALASDLAHAAPPECFTAADEAQTLRDEGHYAAARERLAVCSAAACPAVMQRDCAQWSADLTQLWPTILVRARDLSGRDLADVKVSVDGKPIAARLDGTPIPLDPGEHLLLCETEGAAAVEQSIVVRASEKNRVVDVRFAAGAPVVAAPVEPTAAPIGVVSEGPREPPPGRPVAWLPWAFGGAALTAFGTAAYFGATGLSRYNAMKSSCAAAGVCNPSDVSFTQTHFLVSDVSVGLGLAAAAASAYFFLTARSSATAPPARSGTVIPEVLVGRDGASFGAAGAF